MPFHRVAQGKFVNLRTIWQVWRCSGLKLMFRSSYAENPVKRGISCQGSHYCVGVFVYLCASERLSWRRYTAWLLHAICKCAVYIRALARVLQSVIPPWLSGSFWITEMRWTRRSVVFALCCQLKGGPQFLGVDGKQKPLRRLRSLRSDTTSALIHLSLVSGNSLMN